MKSFGKQTEPMLGEEAGMRAVYRTHGAELYRFALRSLDDGALAEEAVQETFIRAWRASDRYDASISSLRTWLFSIARNVVIDLVRARASHPVLSLSGTQPDDQSADDFLDRALLVWQLEEALRRISHDHRVAIVETYFRQRPYAEVAAELQIPEGTLRSRVYYALRSLRLVLEEMGWEP